MKLNEPNNKILVSFNVTKVFYIKSRKPQKFDKNISFRTLPFDGRYSEFLLYRGTQKPEI